MSRKNANSGLPSELNENWGSNYMMDGFWHDMDYGKGIRDSIDSDPEPQPSTSGFSHLPDGVLVGGDCEGPHDLPEHVEQEEEGAMDLEGLGIVASFDPTSDISTNGVTDHSWLSDAFQDPDRLPDNPHDDMIPELRDAWGDRTDGIRRIDLYDRDAVQPNLGERRGDDDKLHRDKLAHLVRHAMRRSAAGHRVADTHAQIVQMLGPSADLIAAPLRAIETEHGLAGNVYVRASAYPGLLQGKWAKELRRAAKHAKYLIAAEHEDCASCAASMGLKLASHPNEIDWDVVYDLCAPGLEAAGRLRRTASGADKREILRRAFLREGKAPRLDIETFKIKHVMPSDAVTASDARDQLSKSTKVRTIVVNTRDEKIATHRLQRRLGMLVQARLITQDEADRLFKSPAPVPTRLKLAELLAAKTKTAVYQGSALTDARVRISQEEFLQAKPRSIRTASGAEQQARTKLLDRFEALESVRQKALGKARKVASLVDGGLRGKRLRAVVAKSFTSEERHLVASVLDPILVQGGFFEKEVHTSYEGPVLQEAAPQKHVAQASPREISAVVRWAQKQMNEGFVGEELDDLLSHRFPLPILKAASAPLRQVRETHEGVAGHLYVDAAAYASTKGTKGCEEGALRHRTNGLKILLAMKRCENCVFKNAESVCQKYNKTLVHEVPSEAATEFRRKVLAMHRRSDAEDTASLFSLPEVLPTTDVSEYGLHNAALDDVDSHDVEHQSLEGIFFGGFEV